MPPELAERGLLECVDTTPDQRARAARYAAGHVGAHPEMDVETLRLFLLALDLDAMEARIYGSSIHALQLKTKKTKRKPGPRFGSKRSGGAE